MTISPMHQRPDTAWRDRLVRALDARPVRPRQSLRLDLDGAGAPSRIGSIEAALALRLNAACLPLERYGDGWCIVATSAKVDATLAVIAEWLRAEGVVTGWRDELLSVADDAGAALGRIERAAVRALGIASRAVHLVARDVRGAIWVQQRALTKATDPGLWDTTVGGLLAAGESVAQALARETWEEAGLRIDALRQVEPFGRFTARRPVRDGYMVEHIEMVEAVADAGLLPVNQDGEVERFECLERAALIERLHADAFTPEASMILARWLDRSRDDRS